MPPLTKDAMIKALIDASVPVPPSATLLQIRRLYEEHRKSDVTQEPAELRSLSQSDSEPEATPCEVTNEPDVQLPQTAAITSGPGNSAAAALSVELEELHKQRDLLKLQLEIAALQQSMSQVVPKKNLLTDVSVIETMVCKFSADDHYDIKKWFDDLEDAADMLQFDDRFRFIACRRLLEGTARVFVRTIAVSNYKELKAALLEEFGHAFTMQQVYSQLSARRLRKGESYQRYVIEMQEIAMHSHIPEMELIDMIIDGLGDHSAATSMLHAASSIGELKRLLERYERKRARLAVARYVPAPPKTPVASIAASSAAAQPRPPSKTAASAQEEPIRCYNCSQFGHYQSQCTKPKRPAGSCFKCGAMDHVFRSCPHRAAVAAVMQSQSEGDDDMIRAVNELSMVSVAFKMNSEKSSEFKDILSLYDSGSPKSFIRESEVPYWCIQQPYNLNCRGIGNKQLQSLGQLTCLIKCLGQTIQHKFEILANKDTSFHMLLGRDFLHKAHIKLYKTNFSYSKDRLKHLNKNNLYLKPELTAVLHLFNLFKNEIGHTIDSQQLYMQNSPVKSECMVDTPTVIFPRNSSADTGAFSEECSRLGVVDTSDSSELDVSPLLSSVQLSEFRNMLVEVYYNFPPESVRPIDHIMKLNLKHDTPIFCKPRRLSHVERQEIRQICDDLMKAGIIRPSHSPYASSIVPVRKKDGSLRKCVDYRPLNKVTIRDHYPIPLIEDCIEHLGGKSYFSVIDLKNGFHHVKMHPESIKYTAFVTPDGQYEYLRMPFGLCNGPPEFARYVYRILKKFIDQNLLVIYMDDILIASSDFETHLVTVREVIETLCGNGLQLQMKKCKFAYSELEYLGYLANSSGITLSQSHLLSIKNYPVPKTPKELERCHGLFSYFRRFVANFSKIAYPLTRLLKKNAPYVFSDDCVRAFETLRDKLTEAPVLSIYNPSSETELHCDASAAGFGAVLLQRQADGRLHPVSYFSKTTSPAESRLHSYELETLAIIYALKRFETYLKHMPFKIITDCNSLALTLTNRRSSAKIARWALFLEDYNYTVVHRSGSSMAHVDALSRLPTVAFVDDSELDFQLQITQTRDPILLHLRSRLEKEEVPNFRLDNGVVFHEAPDGHLQLYVPTEMINNVIRVSHENLGHLATDKCCSHIKKNYWFPNMKSYVNNFIKNCLKCIYYTASAHSNNATLYSIPKVPIPFDTLHIDHLGPLPSINCNKKYLLVVIDAFTKFVKLYPSRSTTADEVCAYLETQYFRNFSRPRRIISDRGTCFTSAKFSDFVKSNNIVHVLTSTATPRANGQVERVNRVLGPMLSKLSEPLNHSDWVKQITKVEYALNNSVHASTKFAPSVLLFGTEQRGTTVDELYEHLDRRRNVQAINLPSIRKIALENIEKAQSFNTEYFNKHHRAAVEFSEGDYVVVRHVNVQTDVNKKLIQRFRGPYVIHKKLPNDRYVIRDIDGCQITQLPYDGILEAARLKLWCKPAANCVSDRLIESNTYSI